MQPDEFKRLMAKVPAPVTVVTTRLDGAPRGATVSSLASLSMNPPLVSIALIEGSTLLNSIRSSKRFAINLLGHRQAEIALQFAARSDDRFAGVSWHWQDDLPKLSGVAGFIACDLHQEVSGGDHAMLFGLIRAAHHNDELPLIYTAREFGTNSKLVAGRKFTIADAISACAS
ncbi:flavin reductase (DIM6/NTAB) family NADH-FMN oxidoreductase RutF [Pseudorhodoplanes sinuspersici]|nr:flavin reductase family protein [Pseudorhodoplanes sinuspersici]RKE68417.1 flavin reductase (DIM6/NTAB) family NADH-FMN oxidoreductase RutF [Pseudorhodoplanes sinuspersici]